MVAKAPPRVDRFAKEHEEDERELLEWLGMFENDPLELDQQSRRLESAAMWKEDTLELAYFKKERKYQRRSPSVKPRRVRRRGLSPNSRRG